MSAAVPILLAMIGGAMLFSSRPLADRFFTGAREGMQTCVRLLPTLILMTVGISMFTASGAADAIAAWLSPLLTPLGIPEELIGFLVTRPLSGGASTATAAELFARIGTDSRAGIILSLILATSDTVFYIIPVYMAAGGVKKSRHAVIAALAAMVFCFMVCCAVGNRIA